MRQEKAEVECWIAEMSDFEVDQHEMSRPDQQVLGAEIAVDERAAILPHRFDQSLDCRRQVSAHAANLTIVWIETQPIEVGSVFQPARNVLITPRGLVQLAQHSAARRSQLT